MKYTRSKDGIDRATIRVELRCTKEEFEELQKAAKEDGADSVRGYLHRCLTSGIFADREAMESDRRSLAE